MASELKEMPDPKIGRRHRLNSTQTKFFQMGKAQIQKLSEQMNGALQYICLENDIKGIATLSDDATEIIES